MGYNDQRWGSDDDRYRRGRDDNRGNYGDRGGYGRPGDYDRDDRGFFQRAGDEVRSWFGDEEAERRRQYDERYDDRYDRDRGDRAYGSRDSSGYGSGSSWGGGSYGAGRNYGSGGRDYDSRSDYRQGGTYGRSQGSWGDRDQNRSYGGRDNDSLVSGYGWAGGGDRQRSQSFGQSQGQSRGGHDDNYSSWRDRQMQSFDRDYDDYRRENQSRFESEFSTYRTKRQGQRELLQKVAEHDEVVGSDGQHVGKVDHVLGDRIKLTKNDQAAGGHHHTIPSSWVESVENNKVTISKSADEAKRAWREEHDENDRNRGGLFGGSGDTDRDQNRGSGDTNLNRSFSGTY